MPLPRNWIITLMAMTTKTTWSDEIRSKFGLQPSINPIPNGISNFIQPVVALRGEEILRSYNTLTTGGTIYTTPTDKDFYLTSCTLALAKDAACDQASGHIYLQVITGGSTQSILTLPVITLTAQQSQISLSNLNIKCDKNTAVFLAIGSMTAGLRSVSTSFTGILV